MIHPQLRSRVAGIVALDTVPPSTPRQALRTDDGVTFHVHAVRRGGMGVVHICSTDESPEPHFALKTFDDAHFFDALMQTAVETEARLWMRVSGAPHVLPLVTIVHCDQKPFLVMPAIPPGVHGGVSLADEIHHAGSGLPEDQCFRIALGVAMALAACCERVPGLVHGDIKPDNILLAPGGVPYLTDFGAARLFSQATSGQAVHGTSLYLAPECWDPNPVHSEASDVYAFGATLFEMLSGQAPFGAVDDDPVVLASLHREHMPAFPAARTGSALGRALMQLALVCLAKHVGARPPHGTALRDHLLEIGNEHDPILVLHSLMLAAQAHIPGQSAELTGIRVRALLRQGDGKTALELLNDLPAEQVEGTLMLHYGSAHSLAGRDSEAIPWFERYLAVETDAAQRAIAQNELGLSFKRLGRLEEARALYVGLVAHAPQDLQLMVRSNYAVTLLELGEAGRASELMRALTRQHADSPEAWAILAQSLADAGEAKEDTLEAINAVRNAVRLAPRQGRYRVMLAKMLMETTQDLSAAMEALDAAYGLGYHTREWLVNTLACNLLLDRRQDAEELLLLCSDQLPESATQHILDDALAMCDRIMNGATVGTAAADPFVELREASFEPSSDGTERPEDSPMQPADGAQPVANDDGEQIRARIRQGIQPYLQLRMSYVDGSTLADFYYGVDRSDYVEMLIETVAQIKAETLGMMAKLQRRAKPHEFACCPHCATFMLSQRDEGEFYTCQGCLTRVHLHIVRDPALEGLLARALAALGEVPRRAGQGTLFVAIAADNAQQEQIIEDAFGGAGYLNVANTSTATKIFCAEALNRGLRFPASARIWMRELAAGQSASVEDGTLEELDRLLRSVRRDSGSTWSMSMLLEDPQWVQLALSSEREYAETMITLAEKALDNGELMGCAVHAAIMIGEVSRARQLLGRSRLLRSDDRHTVLAAALIDIAEERCADAIPKLQSVLQANPRDEFARLTLATAYDAVGDATQAAGALARLRADGVIPWPHTRDGPGHTRDQEE